MSAEDTRERIMDAADRLFGAHGFQATSMRALTREAGVNLAAVNYHFGSKQELLRATLSRHLDAINAQRLEQLDALESGPCTPRVREIVEALVRPAFEFSHASKANAEVVQRLSALIASEPMELLGPLMEQIFGEVTRRFGRALANALPRVDPEVVRLRLGFSIGCMVSEVAGRHPPMLDIPTLSDAGRVDHLVEFLSAAFSAGGAP